MPSGLHVHRSIELLELPQVNKLMRREVAGLLQQSYPTELFMATGAPSTTRARSLEGKTRRTVVRTRMTS